ncbi:MAG TPA: alpha/beta hydrolase [Burkholderiaceae bacterium]|jgi:pimeloyl-ACP methyl ester carboxylesterase|nr:alpha/beta hydrolase [Burkholderiaceae bacterium]
MHAPRNPGAASAGGENPFIVFSHANSFPAGTYRVLFDDLRRRGFELSAVERFGHEPAYPVTNNWPHLVEQLIAHVRSLQAGSPRKVCLVGHSLGGFLSLMAAARAPELAACVLLIDSPVLGGWRAGALGLAKRTQLVGSISPGRVSRHRREQWDSRKAALEHFRHKKAFARWQGEVLEDYIASGLSDTKEGKCRLSFEREIETAIYNTLPDNLDAWLRRHPLQCPVGFVGGIQSEEMRRVGFAMTERLVKGRVMMLEGSHLFPMEKPFATAAAIEASLRGMTGRPSA